MTTEDVVELARRSGGFISRAVNGYTTLVSRLVAMKGVWWAREYDEKRETREVCPVEEADVISSIIRGTQDYRNPQHMIVLDLDVPVYLVESSTPGHHHLFIVPQQKDPRQDRNKVVSEGMSWYDYKQLLMLLERTGVLERGYANASIERKFSNVRPLHRYKLDPQERADREEQEKWEREQELGPDFDPDAVGDSAQNGDDLREADSYFMPDVPF